MSNEVIGSTSNLGISYSKEMKTNNVTITSEPFEADWVNDPE